MLEASQKPRKSRRGRWQMTPNDYFAGAQLSWLNSNPEV